MVMFQLDHLLDKQPFFKITFHLMDLFREQDTVYTCNLYLQSVLSAALSTYIIRFIIIHTPAGAIALHNMYLFLDIITYYSDDFSFPSLYIRMEFYCEWFLYYLELKYYLISCNVDVHKPYYHKPQLTTAFHIVLNTVDVHIYLTMAM